ncbi:MAG: GNAT family N-acetyltransferase [Eubacterium sp.]|nr:GNAT family N-acetyltransferase [Eubacterium sp.]
MVKVCNSKSDIIRLWAEAFGDTAEEIEFFIDNVKDAFCICYYENSVVVSMMYLVKCSINDREYRYVYAACTAKAHQGKGYMSELIDYCDKSGYKLCLIPASDSLIGYYSARKIDKKIKISDIIFEQSEEIMEYLLEGYNLTQPLALCVKE